MLRRGAHTKKGAYQLLIGLKDDTRITVGRLGTFLFPAGYYVYTGSAMAGLEMRIRRHLSKQKRFRWHIDYLLEHGHVIGYSIKESSVREECVINRQTLSLPGASVPVVGFGSSDCGCVAHLVYFKGRPCLKFEIISSLELLG
ncbi:MAG: GIY-YIG nuclease family protein [Armatimonadota bacterium]